MNLLSAFISDPSSPLPAKDSAALLCLQQFPRRQKILLASARMARPELLLLTVALAVLLLAAPRGVVANFGNYGNVIPGGDRCLELREELLPCSVAVYGLFPPPPTTECCSALWALTTDEVCACAVGPVGWKELLIKVMGEGGLINIPAALRVPYECKVVHLRPGFLCSPPS